jgi:hypothetical protein
VDGQHASALDELILGTWVRRGTHELGDAMTAFEARLRALGFAPVRLAELTLAEDLRLPAFVLDGTQAVFGHVFWEKFTPRRSRLIFGSEVRNLSGDWAVLFGRASARTVYVQLANPQPWDPEHPC